MSSRTFSGRECWVYRCQSPGELCGHHPELIARGLNGSTAEYLLYSPLREADRGPFDLQGESGPHAVAITHDSMIVSRDPHRSDAARTVRSIPLANVLTVALGEALTLGWLAVRFVEARDVKYETVFFNSTGIGHFRDLVRLWMRRQHGNAPRAGCGINDNVRLNECPAYLAGQVAPLIADLDGVEIINLPEAWAVVDGKPRCRSSSTSLGLSNSLMLLAESERPLQPEMLGICSQHHLHPPASTDAGRSATTR